MKNKNETNSDRAVGFKSFSLVASAVALSFSFSSMAEQERPYTVSRQNTQLQSFSLQTQSLMQMDVRKFQIEEARNTLFVDVSDIGGNLTGGLQLLAPVSFVTMTPSQAQMLRNMGYVVEPDHQVEQVIPVTEEQQLADDPGWGVAKIRAPEVWSDGYTGNNIRICIIDGGVQANHQEFANKVLAQNAWLGSLSADSHGTHVAGIAAALDNNGGVVGVAPDADILNADVFNGPFVQQSTFMEALDWCVDQGARVVNMSYGDPNVTNSNYESAHQAAYDAGVVLIAASGNDGNGNSPKYPAAFSSVVAVNQSNSNDSLTGVGQNGEITAPGANIYSTDLGGGYSTKSGTSMASPHAAGAAALILSANSNLSPLQVRQALANTAVDIGSPNMAGAGRIDVKAAIDSLTGGGNAPPTASFTQSCNQLACNFDGAGSSDSDGSITSYAWNFGDNSSASGVAPAHNYASAGTYIITLTVTDNDGATNSTSQSVTVATDGGGNEGELKDGDAVNINSLAQNMWQRYYFDNDGNYSQFTVTTAANNGDADLYVSFDTEPTTQSYDCRGYTSSSNETCTINNLQTGRYYIGVRAYAATNNITVSLAAEVDNGSGENEAPTASFSQSCNQLACNFDGSGSSDSDGNIVSYSWNFGDNNTASGISPSHTFTSAGNYTVTLIVTDDDGATHSASRIITVTSDGGGTCSEPAWNATSTYTQNQRVSYNGRIYRSTQWWFNTGNNPETSPDWWADEGACTL
ncbi:PKD domain-containing protein [Aliikangiella coralliicola]|uniref:S8 family serine peptidase n=1 Tax=Aliikangiella coralliicola TaxID=2592383 RepID=A0A545U6C0_9GAMM|nr:PKD domain-containing protein [Aliikangiella coralliicola]TQV84953.1 S8 family serine peptidase [Aliikangiella coralliicola]